MKIHHISEKPIFFVDTEMFLNSCVLYHEVTLNSQYYNVTTNDLRRNNMILFQCKNKQYNIASM